MDESTLSLKRVITQPDGFTASGCPVPSVFVACELSWSTHAEPVEEAVGESIIDCLRHVFCAYGKFTFISDRQERFSDRLKRLFNHLPVRAEEEDSARRLHMPGIRNRALWLVDTRNPDIAQDFFLIQAWHYAPCQIAFFRDAGCPSLALSDSEIQTAILEGSWTALHYALHRSAAKAICTPGHDGAWLKLAFRDAGTMRQFDSLMHMHCKQCQLLYLSEG